MFPTHMAFDRVSLQVDALSRVFCIHQQSRGLFMVRKSFADHTAPPPPPCPVSQTYAHTHTCTQDPEKPVFSDDDELGIEYWSDEDYLDDEAEGDVLEGGSGNVEAPAEGGARESAAAVEEEHEGGEEEGDGKKKKKKKKKKVCLVSIEVR